MTELREITLQLTFEENDIRRVERITGQSIESKETLYDAIRTALNKAEDKII